MIDKLSPCPPVIDYAPTMPGPISHHLGQFPPDLPDWNVLVPCLGPATTAVARYDGTLAAIPDPDVL